MKTLLYFWQSRQSRERSLLTLLAAMTLSALFWLCQQSAVRYQQQAQHNLMRASQRLAQMQPLQGEIDRLLRQQRQQQSAQWQDAALRPAGQPQVPLTIATRNASQLHYAPGQASFSELIRWLAPLEQQWHVHASQLELQTSPQGMTVKTLVLQHE